LNGGIVLRKDEKREEKRFKREERLNAEGTEEEGQRTRSRRGRDAVCLLVREGEKEKRISHRGTSEEEKKARRKKKAGLKARPLQNR
jgi:hypothetical protein